MKAQRETLYSVFKEQLTQIFSDVGVLFIIIGASVVYPILYGWVYKKEVVNDVPIAIVDQDGSSLSRQLCRYFDATQQISNERVCVDFAQAKSFLMDGEVKGIIVIPKGVERKILRSEHVDISVFADASFFMYYKQVLTGANYVVGTMNAGIRIKKQLLKGKMMNDAVDKALNIKLDSRPLFNPSGGYASYLMPGVLILILHQTLLMGMGLFAGTAYAEKTSWFLKEGLDVKSILIQLIGRGSAFFVLYIPIAIHLLINSFWFLGYPAWASVTDLLLFAFPFLVATISLALLLSTFFKERTSSMIFLLFTSIPLLFLSGISWPYQNMPGFWKSIGSFIPSTQAIIGIYKMQLMHSGLEVCQDQWFKLWELAVLFFCITLLRVIQLRRKFNL
ncbi:ABC transporter permease [Halosquirtibacter xylanolyticus]|uniref:ABC transporter permease n=1 Tax=Halosquirtibacter xylanolyticus TaxID=3374599 RepID=UPI003747A16A|nr:ABC transporter permease [Prolixibacteraceae bacterium]